MNRNMLRILSLVGLTASALSAQAFLWTIDADLSGLNEVPPNASPATGMSTGTYDDVTGLLTLHTMASGFVAPITAAHIHRAPAGVNGPVIVPLSGATGGTSYMSNDTPTLSVSDGGLLLTGGLYVNIHSSTFPGGEVRGQLRATPEPGTMIALAAGVGALVMRRRRKKV